MPAVGSSCFNCQTRLYRKCRSSSTHSPPLGWSWVPAQQELWHRDGGPEGMRVYEGGSIWYSSRANIWVRTQICLVTCSHICVFMSICVCLHMCA